MFEELIELYKTKRRTNLQQKHPEFYEYLVRSTPFLSDTVTTTQRLWHFWNNSFVVPKCQVCGNPVSWDIVNQQYRKFCSKTCTGQRKDIPVVVGSPCTWCQTNITRKRTDGKYRAYCSHKCRNEHTAYCKANPLPRDEVIRQIDLHNLNTMSPVAITSFLTNNVHLRTSVAHHTSHMHPATHIDKRIKELLGNNNPSKRAALADLVERTYPTLPKSEGLFRIKHNITEAPICGRCNTNPRPWGVRRYQRYCDQCVLDIDTRKVAKQKRKELGTRCEPPNKNTDERLNSVDWLIDMHINKQHTKSYIARLLGVDKETVTNRFNKFGIQSVKYKNIPSEQNEVVAMLMSAGVANIIENSTLLTYPKQIDILLPDYKIAIEYCGLYWHSTSQERITPTYHKKKMEQCSKAGYRLITLYADEWLNHTQLVTNKLLNILGINDLGQKINARSCTIQPIERTVKKAFLDKHHIQQDGPSSINYGLFHNGSMVACMGFISLKDGKYLLSRFATSSHVRGGFSKLLKHFTKHHMWSTITSFADLRWSVGNVYQQNGFVLDGITAPSYEYTKGKVRHHKFNFRRQHLARHLADKFDASLSESENMKQAGWYKIYDCGKQRWVMHNKKGL